MGGVPICSQCTKDDEPQGLLVVAHPPIAEPGALTESQTLLQSTPHAREMTLCSNVTTATAAPLVLSKCRDGYQKVAEAVASFSIEELCLSAESTEMLSHRILMPGKCKQRSNNFPVFSIPSVVAEQMRRGGGIGGEVGLRSFVSALGNGVNFMIVMAAMGALPVDVLVDAALTKFTYIFNGVRRDQPFKSVAGVVVDRFGPAASTFSGCWFTRLENERGDHVVFLFSSSDQGCREAEFLGVCARMLAEASRSANNLSSTAADLAESSLAPDEKGVETLDEKGVEASHASPALPPAEDAREIVANLRQELASIQEKTGTLADARPATSQEASAQRKSATACAYSAGAALRREALSQESSSEEEAAAAAACPGERQETSDTLETLGSHTVQV